MSNSACAQDPIQGLLQRGHGDPQALKASRRGQRPDLQHPLSKAVPTMGVGDQYHLAAVALHGLATLLDIELVVDEHHRGHVVASGELGHEPMHPRLGAKARRAGGHLGNTENIKALGAHGSESDLGAPSKCTLQEHMPRVSWVPLPGLSGPHIYLAAHT